VSASIDGPLLLDTHIWLWYLDDDRTRLKTRIRQMLDRCSSRDELLVSDISAWEIAIKTAKGQLALAMDAALWLDRAEQAPGIRFVPVSRPVLVLSTRLEGEMHGDPADRMLIATALLHSLPLVTADAEILRYAKRNAGLRVVDAR
jgi:PIN domain nuclease of toxin-antitoxin system